MARPASKYPTELELQILKVLWQESPLLARDVQAALASHGRDLAKTSIITTLNTMVAKRYLSRTKQGNMYLFSPRISENHSIPATHIATHDRSDLRALRRLTHVRDLQVIERKEQ